MLEFIILGTLFQNKLTGYDIRKCIESGIGMFYKASFGSIYPLLSKLTEQGLVLCEEAENGNRRQKYYSITQKGKEHFEAWLSAEKPTEPGAEAFMAKVFFFDMLDKKSVKAQMVNFQKGIEDYLKELCVKKERYLSLPNQNEFYYKLSTLYFGIAKLQGYLEWCKIIKEKKPIEQLVHEKDHINKNA
jgi:DNA-binding PadR family transcriptional regulator